MDGTLIDSSTVVPDAFIRTVDLLGGAEVDRETVVATYAKGQPRAMLTHLLGRDVTGDEADVYHRELEAAVVAPFEGVLPTLEALRRAGLPVCVFTGNSTAASTILLRSAGVAVDVLIGGDQVDHPKPAPDGVLLAARRLGVPPERVAYVGDSPSDLGAARAAGAHSVAAAWGHLYDPAEPADATAPHPGDVLELLERD